MATIKKSLVTAEIKNGPPRASWFGVGDYLSLDISPGRNHISAKGLERIDFEKISFAEIFCVSGALKWWSQKK